MRTCTLDLRGACGTRLAAEEARSMLGLVSTARAWTRFHLPSRRRDEPAVAAPPRPIQRPRRWARSLLAACAAAALAVGLLWWGVKHTGWLGPAIADGLRSAFGADAVEQLERFVASTRDRAKRLFPGRRKPRSYSDVAPGLGAPVDSGAAAERLPESAREPLFRPADVGPMHESLAAPGDGTWRALPTVGARGDEPAVFTTMLHPDPKRSWSELFVFAMDLRRVRLHAVPGTLEPQSSTSEAAALVRPGLIPTQDHPRLVAAMNGGFKAEHGHHGMRVGAVTLLPAREHLCTIAAYRDASVRIGTWKNLAETEADMLWWRQAAPCMYEAGKLHPGLLVEKTRNWGAALEGDVVIPRSAVGLDSGRTTLYFSLSNDTTPRIMADGMRHAGATDVAQLDVNWPYPRFILFRRDQSGRLYAAGAVKSIPFDPDDYVRKPSKRDFFYITRAGE